MWQEKNGELYKKFEFKDFKEAFDFMTTVAGIAEKLSHHPRWQNQWNTVEIWLSTHDESKITDKDKALAAAIDSIVEPGKTQKGDKVDEVKLYTDGGSRGNPGPAAGAYVIYSMSDELIEQGGFYIGITTNNQAEYQALVQGLQQVSKLGASSVDVYMDSELIVKQLKGLYKMKNQDLAPHYHKIKALEGDFEGISYTHVPRAMNKQADAEVNRVLDNQHN
jgi:ribonuclease HI/pterin-4a-carbinolamine dehydratase